MRGNYRRNDQRPSISQTPQPGLPVHRLFVVKRSQEPITAKYQPQSLNNTHRYSMIDDHSADITMRCVIAPNAGAPGDYFTYDHNGKEPRITRITRASGCRPIEQERVEQVNSRTNSAGAKNWLSPKQKVSCGPLSAFHSQAPIEQDHFGIVAVLAGEKSSSDCHGNDQTALSVMRVESSEHESPVLIRVIGVIRGLFYSLFWMARRRVPMRPASGRGRWLKAAAEMGFDETMRTKNPVRWSARSRWLLPSLFSVTMVRDRQ